MRSSTWLGVVAVAVSAESKPPVPIGERERRSRPVGRSEGLEKKDGEEGIRRVGWEAAARRLQGGDAMMARRWGGTWRE